MGGHGHHKPPYVVPDHTIYKVEDVKQLREVQERLAKQGLKDPWLRNEVWRYHPGWGTTMQKLYSGFFRGCQWGFAAFLITLAIEKSLGITWDHGDHHDNHNDKHSKEHH